MKENIKVFLKKMIRYVSIVFFIVPINKKKIVAYNFFGNGYGDNPKYLVEEILKIDPSYKVVWITQKREKFPNYIKSVKYNSLLSFYHMITAKLWLDTIRNNPKPLFKRKHQVYIQMWHGGIVLKGIEKDAIESLNEQYIKLAKKDSERADYMLSNCTMRTELIKRAFWFNGEILEFGVPRDDILFNYKDNDEVLNFREKYNLIGKTMILYAPSFRKDDCFYENLEFDISVLKETFETKFDTKCVIAMKCHPDDIHKINFKQKYMGVLDLSHESDSQLVLAASDIVISDYSSMLFDFSLTRKPAFIYAPDYEKYIKTERHLYIDLKQVPMLFSQDFSALITNIKCFDYNSYEKKLDSFFTQCGVFEKGDSAIKIAKYLIDNKII